MLNCCDAHWIDFKVQRLSMRAWLGVDRQRGYDAAIMGLTFSDLRNAPPRKPSAKRSRQDAATFRDARDLHWRRMGECAAENKGPRGLVDWGVEWGEYPEG